MDLAPVEVIRVGVVPSTQDLARPLAVGSVVVAEHQTAGRGRLGRRWETPPGSALLASFVLPFSAVAPLAAGVAGAEACGGQVRLKWPNDLLLGDRKLAGILVERAGARCIVGMGINLTWAPPGAARLNEDRDALLERLLITLPRWFAAEPDDVLAAWRARADTLGRRVRVELPNQSFEGIAEDLGPDGSLIVAGRAFAAGDVVHVRVR